MSVTYGYIKCPRCGRQHQIWYPNPGVWCDCHKICPDGSGNYYPKSGCSWTEYNYTGQLSHYEHRDDASESLFVDKLHITGYCSAHTKYIHKPPLYLEMDWDDWLENPQIYPNQYRKVRGVYR